jgi:hypothetical protein
MPYNNFSALLTCRYMKNKLLPICLLATGIIAGNASGVQAQTAGTYDYVNGSARDYSLSLGKIYRPLVTGLAHSYVGFNVKPIANTSNWQLGTDSYRNGGGMIVGGAYGGLSFFTMPTANSGDVQIFTDSQISTYNRMQISTSGQVNIGTRLPTSQPNYKLAVEGSLVAQSIYVTNPNTWADFVFEPSYKPMALPTLEGYLLKNKHLPHIPSAKEVEANGYNVTEMDAKLLQTVEELTLQVIELSKKIDKLEAEKKNASK